MKISEKAEKREQYGGREREKKMLFAPKLITFYQQT